MGEKKRYTWEEFVAEGKRRFGEDMMDWKFVCPSCGHVTAIRDWQKAGAEEGEVAFSCVGRHISGSKDILCQPPGPCNYAGGGLFLLNPVIVVRDGIEHNMFDFAEA